MQKLCNPLSDHRYSLQRTNTTGETEHLQMMLQDRFKSFEEQVYAETQQLKELQKLWEGVVAEIFQLGVACLGENDMAALISTAETGAITSSPAAKAQPTLFVPEHGSSVHKDKGKRKHVSFAGPDMMSLFPGFLLHAPGHQRKSMPFAPDMPLEEVLRFEGEIAGLGKQQMADLQRLEKEDQQWWKRKQTQLAHTFMQD